MDDAASRAWQDCEGDERTFTPKKPPRKPNIKFLRDLEDECWVVLVNGVEKPLTGMHLSVDKVMQVIEQWSGCSDSQEDMDKIFQELVKKWAAQEPITR